MNMAVVVLTVFAASIAASGLIVAGVGLLLRLRPFDAASRHALWYSTLVAIALLPLAGFAVSMAHAKHLQSPVIITSIATRSTLTADASTRHDPLRADRPVVQMPASKPQQAGFPSAHLALLAVGGWLLVALTGLGILAGKLLRVRAVKRRSSPLDAPLAGNLPWLTDLARGERETYLRLSFEIETPVAIGYRRPVILIPTDLAATSAGLQAIEDLVIHEHAHLVRRDDYTNLVQRTIERIFWFNPFVWIAGERIALEREIAADDVVVARTAEASRYADALWQLAREMRMPAHTLVAPGALFTRKQISVRIEALLASNRAHLGKLGPVTAAAASAVAAVAFAVVAMAAPALELPASAPPAPSALAAWPPAAPLAHHLSQRPKPPALLRRIAPSPVPPPMPARRMTVVAEAKKITPAKLHPRVAEHRVIVWTPQRVAMSQTPSPFIVIPDPAAPAAHIVARATVPPATDGPLTRELLNACVPCNLEGRDLRNLDLHGLSFAGSNLTKTDLRGANVAGASFSGANLEDARFDNADLTNARFVGANVAGASFHGARMVGVRFAGLALNRAAIDAAQLSAILAHGCSGCNVSHMDLRDADLHGVRLHGANMAGTDLSGANLSGARLIGVNFAGAKLDNADLRNASLIGCNFSGTSTNGTQLEGASLVGVNLGRSDTSELTPSFRWHHLLRK